MNPRHLYLMGKNTWMSPEHCVVITGYDLNKNIVYIMDPMEGNVTRNLETFQSRYERCTARLSIL
ncbi:MAG: C39 family peptidase [Lachnospira pectinoschiza]